MLILAFSCCLVFMFCGLPGNIITILALYRCKKVREVRVYRIERVEGKRVGTGERRSES